jgi:hypothetical protein
MDNSKKTNASSLRIKEYVKQAISKKKTEFCLLLDYNLACSSRQHCVTFKKMVTATRTPNPVSWFPLLGRKNLVEP